MAGEDLSSEPLGIAVVLCLHPTGQLPGLGLLPRRADAADFVLLPGPQGQPQGVVGESGVAWQQGGQLAAGYPHPCNRGRQSLPTPLLFLLFPVLQSSVVALPLNLSGAVCTPDAEYTKKTNCFRLQ